MPLTMDFHSIVVLLEQGKRMRRLAWSKEDEFIFERPGDVLPKEMIPNVKSLPQEVKDFLIKENRDIEFSPYVCIFSEGKVLNGWLPNKEDMLAEDWTIVE